jgi:hypothetical protein
VREAEVGGGPGAIARARAVARVGWLGTIEDGEARIARLVSEAEESGG